MRTHYSEIANYLGKKGKLTEEKVRNVFNILANHYTITETSALNESQISILKVECTDHIFKELDIVSSFDNRVEFARTFFTYEPAQSQNNYIDWLENTYVEDNKDVVKGIYLDASKNIQDMTRNLKIAGRNIGIGYNDELKVAVCELVSFLEIY